MPYEARPLFFSIVDSDGVTTRDISPHLTFVDGLPGTRELVDVSRLGDSGQRFVASLTYGEFVLEGLYNKDLSTGLDTILTNLLDMTTPTSFVFGPTGSTAVVASPGNRVIAGGAWIKEYNILAQVGSAVEFEVIGVVAGDLSFATAGYGPYTVILDQIQGGLVAFGDTQFQLGWLNEQYDPDSMYPFVSSVNIKLPVIGTYNVSVSMGIVEQFGGGTYDGSISINVDDSDFVHRITGAVFAVTSTPAFATLSGQITTTFAPAKISVSVVAGPGQNVYIGGLGGESTVSSWQVSLAT